MNTTPETKMKTVEINGRQYDVPEWAYFDNGKDVDYSTALAAKETTCFVRINGSRYFNDPIDRPDLVVTK